MFQKLLVLLSAEKMVLCKMCRFLHGNSKKITVFRKNKETVKKKKKNNFFEKILIFVDTKKNYWWKNFFFSWKGQLLRDFAKKWYQSINFVEKTIFKRFSSQRPKKFKTITSLRDERVYQGLVSFIAFFDTSFMGPFSLTISQVAPSLWDKFGATKNFWN